MWLEKGIKVSRNETEYLHVNDRDAEVKVTMQGLEIVKVMFKYLESPTQSNIQRGAEEKSASVRGDLWQRDSSKWERVVRPAMIYDLETVVLTKRQPKLEVAELKIFIISGQRGQDYIWQTAQDERK